MQVEPGHLDARAAKRGAPEPDQIALLAAQIKHELARRRLDERRAVGLLADGAHTQGWKAAGHPDRVDAVPAAEGGEKLPLQRGEVGRRLEARLARARVVFSRWHVGGWWEGEWRVEGLVG